MKLCRVWTTLMMTLLTMACRGVQCSRGSSIASRRRQTSDVTMWLAFSCEGETLAIESEISPVQDTLVCLYCWQNYYMHNSLFAYTLLSLLHQSFKKGYLYRNTEVSKPETLYILLNACLLFAYYMHTICILFAYYCILLVH